MFAEERYSKIVELVNQKGKVMVTELSDALHVSQVTIRRDLEWLEEKEQLIRTHGGAVTNQLALGDTPGERSFIEKQETHSVEKERIAEAAADMIAEEDSILLTPGTTNMLLAKKLIHRKGITVVTNASNIATMLGGADGPDVILLGGKLRRKSYALVGPLTEEALSNIRVNKLFLGVDGFHMKEGLTTPNLAEASVNRRMIQNAKQVIVVADRSKFNVVKLSFIADVQSVHMVITDRDLDEVTQSQIIASDIQLLLV